jgi:hypothetical protein|tara:strand:- start:161 stop:307 length:147 start_codon:yes stop_codon:yes gene_type:complete
MMYAKAYIELLKKHSNLLQQQIALVKENGELQAKVFVLREALGLEEEE